MIARWKTGNNQADIAAGNPFQRATQNNRRHSEHMQSCLCGCCSIRLNKTHTISAPLGRRKTRPGSSAPRWRPGTTRSSPRCLRCKPSGQGCCCRSPPRTRGTRTGPRRPGKSPSGTARRQRRRSRTRTCPTAQAGTTQQQQGQQKCPLCKWCRETCP